MTSASDRGSRKRKPTLIVIIGPTASGKTRLGIQLAQELGGAVVSADSRQVYAGMNIGTAKPRDAWTEESHDITQSDLVEGIPHYLLNIRTPNRPLTLASWQQAAHRVIDMLARNATPPLLVGGTMLYIDSVVYNYDIPAIPPQPDVRGQLENQDTNILYAQLLERDPGASEFIEPHHKRRIIRALEVIQATGKPFSTQRKARPAQYPTNVLGLFPGWEALEQRITARAQQMFNEGLAKETAQLQQHYGSTLPLLQTMHYVQAADVLAGGMSVQEACAAIARANMRYAHRQMSWWNKRKEIRWFEAADVKRVLGLIKKNRGQVRSAAAFASQE